jgi:hypothetical protein
MGVYETLFKFVNATSMYMGDREPTRGHRDTR